MVAKPIDTKLYNSIKLLADKKFIAPTSIYKSSWIVREYKKAGGKYVNKGRKGTKDKVGLNRWFNEKWVDLNRPIKKNGKVIGYEPCGRTINSKVYPLCRPSIRVTKDTPKTYQELSNKIINAAKKKKAVYTYHKNILFK
jgi:hypothetical protein